VDHFTTWMMYMRDWGYKLKYSFLRTISKKWKDILSHSFALVGTIFTLAEILDNVFNKSIGYTALRSNFIVILIAIFIISICIDWEHLKCTYFLEDTDIQITLLVGDIFHQKGAIVIPTNTTFDTLMDDEFISIHSVQGQYQEKYYHNNLKLLNSQLIESLEGIPYIELADNRQTNAKQYEIGTACKISRGMQHTYFLAVANINKFGKPINATFHDITTSLVCFWQNLNTMGHIEELLIPLLGTGRAGVKDASRDKIIQEIIFSFIVAAREMKITESLTICIHPSDFAKKNLHWDDMCDYLYYMCKFKYSEQSSRTEGQPESEVAATRYR